MFYRIFMPVVCLIQLWLCFCRTRLVIRLLPLLAGILLEAASWGLLYAVFSVTSDPNLEIAAVISLGIIFGILIMFAAGGAWAVYGGGILFRKLWK